jgi:hypothetical protein
MKIKVINLDLLFKEVHLMLTQSRSPYDVEACAKALTCFEGKKITDEVKKVKFLFDKFKKDTSHCHQTAWAYLVKCMLDGTITKLPDEEWAGSLLLHGGYILGGSHLILKYTQKVE